MCAGMCALSFQTQWKTTFYCKGIGNLWHSIWEGFYLADKVTNNIKGEKIMIQNSEKCAADVVLLHLVSERFNYVNWNEKGNLSSVCMISIVLKMNLHLGIKLSCFFYVYFHPY